MGRRWRRCGIERRKAAGSARRSTPSIARLTDLQATPRTTKARYLARQPRRRGQAPPPRRARRRRPRRDDLVFDAAEVAEQRVARPELDDLVTIAEPVWKSKFYGAFVLNHRVDLHAIEQASRRWRGGAGSSPLDGAGTAASSTRNDLVKNYRVHPTHWLISTQFPTPLCSLVSGTRCFKNTAFLHKKAAE